MTDFETAITGPWPPPRYATHPRRTAVTRTDWLLVTASLLIVIGVAASAAAQAPPQGPQVVSPEVTADRRIVLRVLAPQAQAVRLNASDIPGVPLGSGATMTKGQ